MRNVITNREIFTFDDLSAQLALILFESQYEAYSKSWKSAGPSQNRDDPDLQKLSTVIWSLVSEGVFYPRIKSVSASQNPYSEYLFCLTRRGLQLIGTSSGHPSHPDFVSKIKAAAPAITDEVLAAIEDASECLSRGLLRASVVMLGLASEITLSIALEGLLHTGKVAPLTVKRPKAQQVIDLLRATAVAWPDKDQRHDFEMALVGLDVLRRERNNAAHPHPVGLDPDELESLLITAVRQITEIWKIPIATAINEGYPAP